MYLAKSLRIELAAAEMQPTTMEEPSEKNARKYRKAHPCIGISGMPLKGGHRSKFCSHCRCCSVCAPPPFCNGKNDHGSKTTTSKRSKGNKVQKQKGANNDVESSTRNARSEFLSPSPSSEADDELVSRKRKGVTNSSKNTKATITKKARIELLSSESEAEGDATVAIARKSTKQSSSTKKPQKSSLPEELEEACKLLQSKSYPKSDKVALLHSLVVDLSRSICDGNVQLAKELIENDLSPLLFVQKPAISSGTSTDASAPPIETATAILPPDVKVLKESVLLGLRGYEQHFEKLSASLSAEQLANKKLEKELNKRKEAARNEENAGLQERHLQLEQDMQLLDENHRRATDALSFQTIELQQEKRRRMVVEHELLELQKQEHRKWKRSSGRHSRTSSTTSAVGESLAIKNDDSPKRDQSPVVYDIDI